MTGFALEIGARVQKQHVPGVQNDVAMRACTRASRCTANTGVVPGAKFHLADALADERTGFRHNRLIKRRSCESPESLSTWSAEYGARPGILRRDATEPALPAYQHVVFAERVVRGVDDGHGLLPARRRRSPRPSRPIAPMPRVRARPLAPLQSSPPRVDGLALRNRNVAASLDGHQKQTRQLPQAVRPRFS